MWGTRRHILGFDWADDTVKAVRVRCGRGRPQLVDFALRTISESNDSLSIFREASWRGRRADVSCAFAGRSLQIRMLTLPLQGDYDLIASLPFEIRRHIPAADSADQTVIHQVIDRNRASSQMTVLVTIAPTVEIQDIMERYQKVGVRPGRMEAPPLAAANHLEHSGLLPDDDTCWGLLDVGATGSWLALSRKGGPLTVRSIHIGGTSFTQELVLRCRLSREEADQVKRAEISLGKIRPEWRSRPTTLPALLRNTLDGLAEEVSNHTNQFRTKNGPVRKLFIAGGGALVHSLDRVLENRLALPVKLVDPFEPFDLPSAWPDRKRNQLAEIGPRFLTAVGLTRWWRR